MPLPECVPHLNLPPHSLDTCVIVSAESSSAAWKQDRPTDPESTSDYHAFQLQLQVSFNDVYASKLSSHQAIQLSKQGEIFVLLLFTSEVYFKRLVSFSLSHLE